MNNWHVILFWMILAMRVTLGLLVWDSWARLVYMTDKHLADSPTRSRHFFSTYRVHACIFFNESPCIMDAGKELIISRYWCYIRLSSSRVPVGRSIIFATRANSRQHACTAGSCVGMCLLQPVGFKSVEWAKDLSMTHAHACTCALIWLE
jgi:hypothetical protein